MAQQQQQAAPVAGIAPMAIGVTVDEMILVVKGWSAKNQVMGKDVFNDKGEKIGSLDDLIIAPDKAVSYAILGAGGFLGVDKHDVAIPVNQFKLSEGKFTLPGATKEPIKAMPAFKYAQ